MQFQVALVIVDNGLRHYVGMSACTLFTSQRSYCRCRIIIIIIKVLQQHKEKYEHNKGDDDFMEMLKAYY